MTESAISVAAIAEQKRALKRSMLIAAPVHITVWLALYFGLPPVIGMDGEITRLVVALKCICLAVLFCLLAGVEAVAHERLRTPAINPLAGAETARMRVNIRFLQNTLEQLVIFASGLLGLAAYCTDGSSMRAVIATTLTWIASRYAFWIGYHRAPRYRAIGLTGTAQSLVVLLYVGARIGYEAAGSFGAAIIILLFAGLEAFLVIWTKRPAP